MATVSEAIEPVREIGLDFSLTVLGSGSSGNCSLVSQGDTHILIDAGFSCVEICRRLQLVDFDPERLTGVLVTHEHSDHIKSVHTLSNKFKIPLLCTEGTFAAAFQGKRFFDWQEIKAGRAFHLGSMSIHPISLPHDAADPIGFRVECNQRILGHITDVGYPSALVIESLKGCDTLLVEANHDLDMLKEGPYPWPLKQRIAGRLGHLSNGAFLDMLPEILHENVGHMVIAHLSRTNNDPRLISHQVKRTLRQLGLPHIPFTIAEQDSPMGSIRI